jgi:outer membrane protein assembly factor BamE (lipoprotein component of BamABCDE complex)
MDRKKLAYFIHQEGAMTCSTTRILLVTGLFVLLTGCISGGNPSIRNEASTSQVKVGVTTKEEVRMLLGKPTSIGRGSGNLPPGVSIPVSQQVSHEVWNYTHLDVETNPAAFIPIIGLFFLSSTVSTASMTIYFDEQGIVKHFSTTEYQSESGPWAGTQKPAEAVNPWQTRNYKRP